MPVLDSFPLPLPLPPWFASVADEYDDRIFESSKMTFGEHLNELRTALIKSVLALVIGFCVGLLPPIAGGVVRFVQRPLNAALEQYYRGIARAQMLKILKQQAEAGAPVPQDLEAAADLISQEGLVPEEHYFNPRDLLDVLTEKFPQAVDGSQVPARSPAATIREQLAPLVLYHKLEDDPRLRIVGLAVQEGFTVYIKAALLVGAVIASPFIFYFMWSFVAAGLYPHERHYVHLFLPVSLGLFLAGVLLAFFVVFSFVLIFLLQFYDWLGLDPDPRITDWLSFVLILPLGFGISFQLPLVMLFLERIGIFSLADYMRHWRIAVVVISVISMVLTPTDVSSMILMAVPLILLYFGGVLMCRYMPRREAGVERFRH